MKGSWLLAVGAGASLSAVFAARGAVTFEPTHSRLAPAATLSAPLVAEVDRALAASDPRSVDEVAAFSLEQAGKRLHFGLRHPTRMSFDAGEREGNCIEYAHLFGKIFERAARRAGLEARVFVVHSAKARVFGLTIPLRGFGDHDWAMVEDRGGGRVMLLDPAFHDAGLGADITRNVVAPPGL